LREKLAEEDIVIGSHVDGNYLSFCLVDGLLEEEGLNIWN